MFVCISATRAPLEETPGYACDGTANLRAKILDFGGFDSSRILILRGGTLMSIGDSPESLSEAILVGIINISREIERRIATGGTTLFHNPRRSRR